jgi:hypothetical protein
MANIQMASIQVDSVTLRATAVIFLVGGSTSRSTCSTAPPIVPS